MNPIISNIEVDLTCPTSYEVIIAQQGDTERWLYISLTDDGEPYSIPQDTLIRFEGTRPDSSSFLITDCELVEDVIRLNLFQAINKNGIVTGKVVLNNGVEVLSSIPIIISVQEYGYDKDKLSEVYKTAIEELTELVMNTTTFEIISNSQPENQKIGQFWLETY